MNIEQIIDEAYELYMPQVREEITQLATLLVDNMKWDVGQRSAWAIPYNILEIGTKFGGTFYVWNKLVEAHGAGMCISIDMSDGGLHGGVSTEQMDKRDLWFHERFDNCHFIRGNSHDKETLMKCAKMISDYEIKTYPSRQFIDLEEIDLLFIDGDHSFDGVKNDFEFYSQFCKKGSLIVFHDIIDSQRHREREVFVSLFWNEIKHDPRFESFEIVGDRNQDWAGLGILLRKL